MSDIAFRASDRLHHSVLVEFDHRPGQVEVDRATAHPLAIEDQREITHHLEHRNKRGIALAQDRVAFQYSVHIGVGHALSGADHTFVEFVAEHFTAVIDFHDAGKDE